MQILWGDTLPILQTVCSERAGHYTESSLSKPNWQSAVHLTGHSVRSNRHLRGHQSSITDQGQGILGLREAEVEWQQSVATFLYFLLWSSDDRVR